MKFKAVLVGTLVILILSMFLVSCNGNGGSGGEEGNVEALAKCLTDSGAKFYGAYWCPHCVDQKDLFGEAVEFAPYVECTVEQQACVDAGVEAFPTWIFADGTVVMGGQSLEKLAELGSCEY